MKQKIINLAFWLLIAVTFVFMHKTVKDNKKFSKRNAALEELLSRYDKIIMQCTEPKSEAEVFAEMDEQCKNGGWVRKR